MKSVHNKRGNGQIDKFNLVFVDVVLTSTITKVVLNQESTFSVARDSFSVFITTSFAFLLREKIFSGHDEPG